MIPVHVVALGCARNDADSEELAGRLDVGGFELVAEPADAEVIVVNTCGFIDAAKKDSIDSLLAMSALKEFGKTKAVVAVGCLAQRYGRELAEALPETDAVLSFDDYPRIAERLQGILAGDNPVAHVPVDRRLHLPITPSERPGNWPASGPRLPRKRLSNAPSAALKIASGCDRRCAFCAIPYFRGSFLSRTMDEIVLEAEWLVSQDVKEVVLVSENTSSYGKELADPNALVSLLGRLNRVDGLEWIRVSYLQPAEVKPALLEAIVSTPKVVPYFDLSFQHASASLLRRMRRFGDAESFLKLIGRIRELDTQAGIRSNVILGFPGETEEDVEILAEFLAAAELDAVGVFAYSDEEGTEGAGLTGKLSEDEIADRTGEIASLVDHLIDNRAASRVGEEVKVLVEEADGLGRAAHQGPEVDGTTQVAGEYPIGAIVSARIVGTEGVDLLAEPYLSCENG